MNCSFPSNSYSANFAPNLKFHGSDKTFQPTLEYKYHPFYLMTLIDQIGSIKIDVYTRDCVRETHLFDGCVKETTGLGPVVDVLKGVLSFISGLGDIEIDGDACFCRTDYCIPESCPDGETNVLGYGW